MTMTPRLRKLALTAHVTTSVGWLGAVGSFLALAVAGLISHDSQLARGAYLAMKLTGWFVIVPLCLASVLTGLVLSLGTTWGLFRHYWVEVKLFITIPASLLLLLHMQPVNRMAVVVAERAISGSDLHSLRIQILVDAAAALIVLLGVTALSVYKPQGMTRYGWRKQRAASEP
jgi:hypothetical protein